MQGKIKWFSSKKGFGFITSGDRDYFVHISEVEGDIKLEKGDEVVFEPKENPKGMMAIKVRRKEAHTKIYKAEDQRQEKRSEYKDKSGTFSIKMT